MHIFHPSRSLFWPHFFAVCRGGNPLYTSPRFFMAACDCRWCTCCWIAAVAICSCLLNGFRRVIKFSGIRGNCYLCGNWLLLQCYCITVILASYLGNFNFTFLYVSFRFLLFPSFFHRIFHFPFPFPFGIVRARAIGEIRVQLGHQMPNAFSSGSPAKSVNKCILILLNYLSLAGLGQVIAGPGFPFSQVKMAER